MIHGKVKILHLHMRTAKGRPVLKEINSFLISLLVNTKSMQRRVMMSMMIRDILDHIQENNIYQI